MVLLSITPLLDGVLRLDIIAPFHTSGPPLLQFHLAIEQWGYKASLTAEATAYPIAFTSLVYVFPFVYEHKQTSNTAHAIAVDVTNKAFKFYAGQYNLPSLPLPDANGWWLAGGF